MKNEKMKKIKPFFLFENRAFVPRPNHRRLPSEFQISELAKLSPEVHAGRDPLTGA